MNRRNFLKNFTAVSAVAVVPTVETAVPQPKFVRGNLRYWYDSQHSHGDCWIDTTRVEFSPAPEGDVDIAEHLLTPSRVTSKEPLVFGWLFGICPHFQSAPPGTLRALIQDGITRYE